MHASSTTLDALGSGPGFRKIRPALDITAFGVNAIVFPPGGEGFWHFHETQDELYFVHAGTARFDAAEGEETSSVKLGPGGLFHAPAASHRRVSNAGDDELVVLVVGAADGYVGRDGMLVDMNDLARRQQFGSGS